LPGGDGAARPAAGGSALIDRLHVGLGSLSGLATMVMMLIIVPDVLLRKFFNVTIPGAAEGSVLLLVLMVYLGLAGAEARGANFAASFFIERRSGGQQRAAAVLTTLAALGFAALMAWLTGKAAWASMLRGESTFGIVRFPIWPSRMVIALGFALLTLQFALQLQRLLRGLPPRPVAASPVEMD